MRKICFGLVVAVLQALHEKDQQLKAVGEAVVAQVRLRHFPSFGCRTSIFVVSGAWMFCLHSFFGCHVHISLLHEAAQFDRKTNWFHAICLRLFLRLQGMSCCMQASLVICQFTF